MAEIPISRENQRKWPAKLVFIHHLLPSNHHRDNGIRIYREESVLPPTWIVIEPPLGHPPAVMVPQPRPPGFPHFTLTERRNPQAGQSLPAVPEVSRPFSVFPHYPGGIKTSPSTSAATTRQRSGHPSGKPDGCFNFHKCHPESNGIYSLDQSTDSLEFWLERWSIILLGCLMLPSIL